MYMNIQVYITIYIQDVNFVIVALIVDFIIEKTFIYF